MTFEAEDAAVFFGRDAEIRKVSELLEARRAHGGARLVLIVGASGGGKSSVLKAGVLPYLARDKRRFVVTLPFRPGATPLLAFAKTLAEALGRPADFAAIRTALAGPDPRLALAEHLEALTIGPAREATVLVSIDQFEELFTIAGGVERDAFLRLLTEATATRKDRVLPVLFVATIRSDLLGEILKAKGFSIAHEVFTLCNLPTERLASVIEGPAQIAAIHLEDGLVERILKDVGTAPDALPLLAFTLRELNERYGGDKKLALLEYEELGDRELGLRPLENAVRRTAEDTLAAAEPTPEEMEALREAFVGHLVRVNEDGVRLRRPDRLDDIAPPARRLIDRLVAARLLTVRSEGEVNAVEVAHEALFRVWPKLAGWLTEELDFLAGRRQIEDAERQWAAVAADQKQRALLSGLLLDKARAWTLAHPERLKNVREFIAASARKADMEQATARKRQRILTFASIAAAIGFAGLAFWGWVQTKEAQRQQAAAETAKGVAHEKEELATKEAARATQEAERALAANKTIRVVQRLARQTGDTSAAPQRNLLLSTEVGRLRQEESDGLSLGAIDAVRQQLRQSGGMPLTGHLKSTRVAAFAPAGYWLATGSDDGMVRLWDISRSDLKSVEVVGSGPRIAGLGFSPDGKWLFAGDQSGAVRSWKVENAKSVIGTSNPDLGPVTALAVDPQGRWLAFATESGSVCIWKLDEHGFTAAPCQKYEGENLYYLKFSAKGRWLAAAGAAGLAPIALWDLSDGTLPASPKHHVIQDPGTEPSLTAIAFSGDENRLAVAYGYAAEVWDLTQESPPAHFLARGGHSQWISAVALNPDGRWLVTAASEGRIKLWEVGGSKDPVLLDGHTAPVNSAAFSDDGKWLATSSNDTTARLWDMSGPRTIPGIVLRGQDLPVANAIFGAANGPLMLVTVGNDQHARLWQLADRLADPTVLLKHDRILDAAYSSDGVWIVGATYPSNMLSIRNANDRDAPGRQLALPAHAKAVALSPDRRWLAAALDSRKTVRLWRFPELGTFVDLAMDAPPGDMTLGFSPDSRWLVAGTWNTGVVNLWDVSGDQRPTAQRSCRHGAGVRGISFTSDSRYVFTGAHWRQNQPTEVRIWDLQAADPCAAPRVLQAGQNAIPRVAISGDGRWAVAASFDSEAFLWDLSANDGAKRPLIVTLGERGTAAAFSANGRWVAISDWAGGVAVVDLQASPLKPLLLPAHAGRVNSVAFTPDSKMLVTSGEDRVVRLWDPSKLLEAPVVLRGHEGTTFIAGMTADSRLLTTFDDVGNLLLWHLSLPDLTTLACRTAGRQLTRQELRDLPDADPAKLPCLDQPKLSE